MNSLAQSLPPGWRMQALNPSQLRRACGIRIINPEGREVIFIHKPFQFACELTRQLEQELIACNHPEEWPDHTRANQVWNEDFPLVGVPED
ncbi:MAG TPA: hypothetical protein VGD21_08245 [Lysobacter sp.]